MAQLTEAEQKLFAKYYGVPDLQANEGFWEDVFSLMSNPGTNIVLPLRYNPRTVRRVLDMLDCPPNKCGACCHYKIVSLNEVDIKRMEQAIGSLEDRLEGRLEVGNDGNTYMGCEGGCQFLVDNACSIYKVRPDVCYFFPIQGPVDAIANGGVVQQMRIRLKCRASFEVIRKLITEAVNEGKRILLPDLTIVEKES